MSAAGGPPVASAAAASAGAGASAGAAKAKPVAKPPAAAAAAPPPPLRLKGRDVLKKASENATIFCYAGSPYRGDANFSATPCKKGGSGE